MQEESEVLSFTTMEQAKEKLTTFGGAVSAAASTPPSSAQAAASRTHISSADAMHKEHEFGAHKYVLASWELHADASATTRCPS